MASIRSRSSPRGSDRSHDDSGRSTPSRRHSYSSDRSYSGSSSYSTYSDTFSKDGDHSKSATKSERKNKSYKTPTSVARGSKAKKGKGKRQTPHHATTHSIEEVTKRMLSARRHKIMELKNETEDYKQQLEELRKDNKMLAREQRIQERALGKYESQENDMANILQRHSEEVRVLKEQLRKQKERYQKSDRKRKDAQEELDRTKRLVKKMQSLVNDKELKERDELSRKLTKTESDLDEKERRIKDLEKHVEHLKKNHRHEIGIEMARHRETQQSLQELQNRSEKLEMQIKEKEKELEIKNIYSNRLAKPPHHLNTSVNSTPTPSIRRARSRKRSEPGLTPREKAKLYEIKRRDEEKNKNERNLPSNRHFQPHLQPYFSGQACLESLDIGNVAANLAVSTFHKATLTPHYESTPNKILESSYIVREDDAVLLQKQYSDESKREKLQDIIERKEDRRVKSKRQINDIYNPKQDQELYKPSSAVVPSTVYQSENPGSSQKVEKQILTDDAENSRPKAITKVGKKRDKPWDFTPRDNKIDEKSRVIRPSDRRYQEPGLANTDKERGRNADTDNLLDRMKLEEQPKQNGTEENVEVNNLYEKWERERKEKEERERRRREVEQEQEEDNRWIEDRERRKKESAVAEERRERERREREDKERRELETLKRLEREEEERKQKEEWEREKKENEKRERREREEEARRAREEAERVAQQEIEQKKRREKDALLAKMRALDENKQWENSDPLLSKSKKKDYSFTEPVENMHHGRPAYGNVTVPVLERNRKKSLSDDDNTDIGYLPSFASKSDSNQSHKIKNTSKVGVNNTKKTDLMATLFGSPEHKRSGSSDNDRVFGIANQTKSKNSANKAARENSSTVLYGGGSAIIDDSEAPPSSNSHLLPRRTRQQPTVFHNRPTINAVDDVDDDLEEVVL